MANKNKQNVPRAVLRLALVLATTSVFVAGARASDTTNRLAGNKLSNNRLSANRLAGNKLSNNRLSANRLAGNKLASTRLGANLDNAEILNTEDGREVYSYIISCALPEGTEIEATIPGAADTAPPDTLFTCSNEHCVFSGSLGLAEHWLDRPLDTRGQRWVTACLLARVNHFGVKQTISLRGVAPQLSVSPEEAKDFPLQEGAFYGNIFADPDAPLDWNACRGRDQAASDQGGLALRACAEPDPDDPTHTKCGFKYSGDCGNYSHPVTLPNACRNFDPEDGAYGECLAREGKPLEPAWKMFREVITTYVHD